MPHAPGKNPCGVYMYARCDNLYALMCKHALLYTVLLTTYAAVCTARVCMDGRIFLHSVRCLCVMHASHALRVYICTVSICMHSACARVHCVHMNVLRNYMCARCFTCVWMEIYVCIVCVMRMCIHYVSRWLHYFSTCMRCVRECMFVYICRCRMRDIFTRYANVCGTGSMNLCVCVLVTIDGRVCIYLHLCGVVCLPVRRVCVCEAECAWLRCTRV